MTLNALEWIIWSVFMFLLGGYAFNKKFRRKVKFLITGKKEEEE